MTVVSCDMREFNPPEKADILVSELLGSFSDNELSPECLDGAQKFLKGIELLITEKLFSQLKLTNNLLFSVGGISIPKSYTSYICPVQTSKIYNEVRNMEEKENHSLAQFEKPYVVLQKNKYIIARNQPLFTFHHPNYGIN